MSKYETFLTRACNFLAASFGCDKRSARVLRRASRWMAKAAMMEGAK